jgi:hypothetical protein
MKNIMEVKQKLKHLEITKKLLINFIQLTLKKEKKMSDAIQVIKSKKKKVVKNEAIPRKNICFRLEELKHEKQIIIKNIENLYGKLNIILPTTNDIRPVISCENLPATESQLSQEIYCIQQELLQVNLIFDYILENLEI